MDCLTDLLINVALVAFIVIPIGAVFISTAAIVVGALAFGSRQIAKSFRKDLAWIERARALLVMAPPIVVCWLLVNRWVRVWQTTATSTDDGVQAFIPTQLVFLGMSGWYFLPRWKKGVVSPISRTPFLDWFLPTVSACILLYWPLLAYVRANGGIR